MLTRKEYMLDAPNLHRAYYAQFVTPYILEFVRDMIGQDKIVNSKDEHFNDIPLVMWDRLANALHTPLAIDGAIEYGPEYAGKRFFSLSSAVCILKEAARQIKESHNED